MLPFRCLLFCRCSTDPSRRRRTRMCKYRSRILPLLHWPSYLSPSEKKRVPAIDDPIIPVANIPVAITINCFTLPINLIVSKVTSIFPTVDIKISSCRAVAQLPTRLRRFYCWYTPACPSRAFGHPDFSSILHAHLIAVDLNRR